MKLFITLTCHSRPAYFKTVLDSLYSQNHLGTVLVVGMDRASPGIRSVVKSISLPKIVEDTALGFDYSNQHAYNVAIGYGADVVLALEEDTPMTPDCLEMVRWFASQSDYQFMNCFDLTQKGTEQSARLKVVNTFCPWGWAFKREGYEKWIRPHWMEDARGWDITINELFQREKIPVLQPKMSRMRNIGREGGAHYDPAYYDKVFTGTMWSDGSCRDYRIEQ